MESDELIAGQCYIAQSIVKGIPYHPVVYAGKYVGTVSTKAIPDWSPKNSQQMENVTGYQFKNGEEIKVYPITDLYNKVTKSGVIFKKLTQCPTIGGRRRKAKTAKRRSRKGKTNKRSRKH